MKRITVSFGKDHLTGTIALPASKSISNRLLIARFLSGEVISIENLSQAEDTKILAVLLDKLKQHLKHDPFNTLTLDAGDAGTAFRFLTALLAVVPGDYYLTGSERMKQRPVGILVEALQQLGAEITYAGESGFPPLNIRRKKASGGAVEIGSEVSSQFISALLLIAPALQEGLTLYVKGSPVSRSYIGMTVSVLSQCGISVENDGNVFHIKPQPFRPGHHVVEADWSSAAFWYEMAAIAPSADLLLPHLQPDSIQGDRIAAELFQLLGVKTSPVTGGVKINKVATPAIPVRLTMTDCPDLVLPFAVACSILSREASIEGIRHLEWKESKRITALCHELEKIGVAVVIQKGGHLHVPGSVPLTRPRGHFLSWHDHRMVMALAPLALFYRSVQITEPETVIKSYPGYWDELRKAGFTLRD